MAKRKGATMKDEETNESAPDNESAEKLTIKQENGKFCVYSGEEMVKSFDTEAEAKQYILDEEDPKEKEPDGDPDDSEMSVGFLFTELSKSQVSGRLLKYIDGMASGEFTDMRGNVVKFDQEQLSEYASNTLSAIESTRSEKGEVVGLPIDQNNHDHNGGAGWIVGLQLDSSRNIIKFLVNWTEFGKELISSNVRRYFSPTIDIGNKVVLGGSLTNWPATRTPKGHMILRPIELSANLKSLELIENDNEGVEEMPENTAVNTRTNAELSQFLESPEGVAELSRLASEKAQVFIDAEKRKRDVVEFASTLVGGTREKPFGLPVPTEDVVSVLLSLPEAQAKAVQRLLTKTLNAAINFAERGYGGGKDFAVEGDFISKPKLPEEYKTYLSSWIKSGKEISEFFGVNPELGASGDWNLAEFTKKEK